MIAKVINVEPGAWPKDKKPFWAVSVAQEGKEPIKLYASTQEIGEGLKPGREYDFTLKTTGKEGQPLKYPYITEAVPTGPVAVRVGGPSATAQSEPWPGEDMPTKRPPDKKPAPAKPPSISPTQNGHPKLGSEKLTPRERAMTLAIESWKGQAHSDKDLIDTADLVLRWLEG